MMGWRLKKQHNFRKITVNISIALSIVIGLMWAITTVAQSQDLVITQILQSEENPSIVAFTVRGVFRRNDVVNIYANDAFIKAKPINTPDLVGPGEVDVENISVDVFRAGENRIVAKIERNGAERIETQPFTLTIQEPPEKPVVTASLHKEQGFIDITVTSVFEKDDIVRLFLNGTEVHQKILTEKDAQQESVQITNIQMNSLGVGIENFFEVTVRRGNRESEKSERSESIFIESEEDAVATEQEGVVYQCVQYNDPQIITGKGATHEGFGSSVSAAEGVFAVGTNGRAAYTLSLKGEKWSSPEKMFEPKRRGSELKKIVEVYEKETVFIGNPGSSYRGKQSGSVEMYQVVNGQWDKETTFAPITLGPDERFGISMASDTGTLVVGSLQPNKSGAAYIYINQEGFWNNPFRIAPKDTTREQKFGHSVSVSGNRVVVGAPGDGEERNGAVYIYTKSGSGTRWSEEKVTQDTRRANTRFGTSVLIHGNTLYVGAMRDNHSEESGNIGVVYIYTRQANKWKMVQKITPPASDKKGEFGSVLAHSGTVLAIGSPKSSAVKGNGGAVYLYRKNEGSTMWSLKEEVRPEDIRADDRFGASIAFDNENIIIGAFGRNGKKDNVGAVYLYKAQDIPCAEEEAEVIDDKETVEQVITTKEPGEVLQSLEEEKDTLDRISNKAMSLSKWLEQGIQNLRNIITKREENIVIYDESSVHADAQRQAAAARGIVAPGLPGAVTVRSVDPEDVEASVQKQDPVRTRNAVISETEEKLGTVVPVSAREFKTGDVHDEVYRLQVFLNKNGYIVSREGAGSPGNETSTFSKKTEQALKTFQIVNGIPVTGVLDQKTRTVMLTFISNL